RGNENAKVARARPRAVVAPGRFRAAAARRRISGRGSAAARLAGARVRRDAVLLRPPPQPAHAAAERVRVVSLALEHLRHMRGAQSGGADQNVGLVAVELLRVAE